MKKYLIIAISIVLFFACEDKKEDPLPLDCAGVEGGTAMVDSCDVCVGGTTNEIACTQDCNGVFGGTATVDSCAVCVGGTTNLTACTQDCAGDWGGTGVLDECGVCDGNNSTCLELKRCDLNPSDFIDLMTLTGKIDILSEEQSTSDTLFAFVEESCRGKTTPMPENDNYICYLAIYGNSDNDETVDFYYFQSSTNIFWKLDQSEQFINGQILGDPSVPFAFTIDGE